MMINHVSFLYKNQNQHQILMTKYIFFFHKNFLSTSGLNHLLAAADAIEKW